MYSSILGSPGKTLTQKTGRNARSWIFIMVPVILDLQGSTHEVEIRLLFEHETLKPKLLDNVSCFLKIAYMFYRELCC